MSGCQPAANTRRPRVHPIEHSYQAGHSRPVVLTGEWYSLDNAARKERFGSMGEGMSIHPAFRSKDSSIDQLADTLVAPTGGTTAQECRQSSESSEAAHGQEFIVPKPSRLKKRRAIPKDPSEQLSRTRSISATVGRMYRNVSGSSLLSMLSGERRPQTAPHSGRGQRQEKLLSQDREKRAPVRPLTALRAAEEGQDFPQLTKTDRRKPSIHHDNDEIRQAMERSQSKRQPLREMPVNVPPQSSGSLRQRTKQRVLSIRKKIDKTLDIWRE